MSEKAPSILVVDPDTDFLDWVRKRLEASNFQVFTAAASDEAYQIFCRDLPDLLITETHLQPFSGLELLAKTRQHNPNAMVIITSTLGTTQTVVESMKLGAFDYIRKEALPFNLKQVVNAALTEQEQMRAAVSFKPTLTVEQHQDSIVGQSVAMQQIFKVIGRVAYSDATVMITGERGSGKKLVARTIHQYSQRSGNDFIAIDCAAFPEELLEDKLFGHEKGAYPDTVSQRAGYFEQCNGCTLFLDEIGDVTTAIQSKLLRVL